MKYKDLDQKGYSAMELLIALTIAGLVLSPLCTYFVCHYRYFIQAENQLEVQYHMQIAMEELVDKLIYTKGIQQVQFYDLDRGHVKKIVFDNSAQGDSLKKKLVIEHRRSVRSLWYGYGSQANVIYANDIEEFRIIPIEGTYQKCRGVRIYMISSRGNVGFEAENEVYFRNYEE